MSETRDGARRRQELRRSNAAVPIPSRKEHRPADRLRDEIELAAEVCREHRASDCGVCDEHNDAIWVHPRDLPLPHEDCPLCHTLVSTRQERIADLQGAVEMLEGEIIEIQDGKRHNAFHESQRAALELP